MITVTITAEKSDTPGRNSPLSVLRPFHPPDRSLYCNPKQLLHPFIALFMKLMPIYYHI